VKLYELSDYIGCMSPANVEYVLKNNKISSGKVELCPNSIEPRNYEFSEIETLRLKEKYNIPSESCVFIYGGNLGKPQGLDFLIKVLDSNRHKTDCFFVIVGSGTEKPILDIWFDENCPQNAVLLENLPKSDFDILMGICDVGLIFLDPRFSIPNYPSRLLSYMETRKPVLIASDKSTDVGQIAESNKYGFWCESGDLQSFNNYVEILSKNEKKRIEMGGNAYGFLLENYVVQKSAAIILKHFCEDT
jgi:glycosyltransferase involved in cell wall biosynthesis